MQQQCMDAHMEAKVFQHGKKRKSYKRIWSTQLILPQFTYWKYIHFIFFNQFNYLDFIFIYLFALLRNGTNGFTGCELQPQL